VSKRQIIIGAIAGLLSFTGAFITALLLGRSGKPTPVAATTAQQAGAQGQQTSENAELGTVEAGPGQTEQLPATRPLNDKQLKSLVYEVREKIREYENKAKELEVREARLQITQETLKKDIEELNRMRVELAALVASLKEEKNKLFQTRVEIAQSEKANLASIAATYDKMDPSSASKILSNMCSKQMESGRLQGGAIDDAVKILYYMTERTKAKVLAEMVAGEPKLSAVLCQRLKEIVEQK
jgi:flagellar motility protein MotE (MotC chaperone)